VIRFWNNEVRERKLLTSLMSLRGGRISRRLRSILQGSNLLGLEKARLSSFSVLLEIASGKQRPRNDIVSLVGEGTYIFTDPKRWNRCSQAAIL